MASKGNEEAAQKLDRLQDGLDAAVVNLLNIAPTTIAGIAAVLAYAAAFVMNDDGAAWPDGEAWISRHKFRWEVILHRNLAKTLQAMAVQHIA